MRYTTLAVVLVALGLRAGLAAEPAPGFELADLSGRFVHLKAMPAGPKLINFWQRDCPPCREELPLLGGFAAQHPEVQLITVALQTHADTWQVRERLPAAGTHLVAPLGQRALLARFGNRTGALPHTVWLDAQGAICAQFTGALTHDRLVHNHARCSR